MYSMKKIFKLRLNIFQVLLILLILLSSVPILVLITQSIRNLNTVKKLSHETIEATLKEQSVQTYKSYARNLAYRISDFLYSCEADLKTLATFPPQIDFYLHFSRTHQRYVTSLGRELPIFKEIAFIDPQGQELVKIQDDRPLPAECLKNVSDPANTTFKSERYFEQTLTSPEDIYVSHLTGWYVSRTEQMQKNTSYEGVIRFCQKIRDRDGHLEGILMVALDHRHLMEFIWQKPHDIKTVIQRYKTGNYTYLIDDEGWIIAHPKLWDIRGLDRDGRPVEPLTEQTPVWKYDAGVIPINLLHMDWRLRDIYTGEPMSSIINRVRRGETVVTTMKSMGIQGQSEGIVRARAYAPIFYDTGEYSKYGTFGAVAIGTSLEEFLNRTTMLRAQIEEITRISKRKMAIAAVVISFLVLLFSFLVARTMASPLMKLNKALVQIGEGDYQISEIKSPFTEITQVSQSVKRLAEDLNEKDIKIKQYVKDLEIVNIKLAAAQKELDSYLKHEYAIESDQVLEEKIAYYENIYPSLREIRRTVCIGTSPEFLRVLRQIIPLSQMTIPMWLYGESGVGKTAIARAMHLLSPRRDKCFQVFEASEFAAADPMIVLGKLFGYGSGHGLHGIDKNGQAGILEQCDGGTLLIDDVDALPLETQAQLLRVVDGLDFHPAAGKSRNIISDVRFIFATNVDLEQLVKENRFRKDLFRRMGGSINKIEIPPLRNRRSDIPLLVDYFIQRYTERNKIHLEISEEALTQLLNYDYVHGNIGELEMIIELACESCRIENEKKITRHHLPAGAKTEAPSRKESDYESGVFTDREARMLEVLCKNHFRMEESEAELGYNPGSRTLSHHLRGICLKALSHSEWDIDRATSLVADSSSDKVKKVLKHRIQRYVDNILQKGEMGQKASLYKNLPKEYHIYVEQIMTQFPSTEG